KQKIPCGNHPSQFGELYMPAGPGPHPIIVTIHGGFWQSKYDLYENNPICDDLASKDFAVWNVEYRRTGEDGGGWTGTFNDVITAVNHLSKLRKTYHLNTENITIIGHSAGGHLALWLASRANTAASTASSVEMFDTLIVPLQKIISLAGVTDLKQMWKIHKDLGIDSPVAKFIGGSPIEYAGRYKVSSPIELLPKQIGQILIHGDLDRHVPVELSKTYYNK